MCGFTGFASHQKQNILPLLKANLAIAHRGEDDEGFAMVYQDIKQYSSHHSCPETQLKFPMVDVFQKARVAFGFRRLSILDLSVNGYQPMLDNGILLCFNGEIYNHAHLREKLAALGHQFKSKSDTEVLIKAYQQWGLDFVQELDGMFAMAIFNRKTNQIHLLRDRLGIKPLYYYFDGDTLFWASEIKALFEFGASANIDKQGLVESFMLMVTPAPRTPFEDVKSVAPAEILSFDLNDLGLKKHRYWQLAQPKIQQQQNQVLDELEALLQHSIQQQLQADVPVACIMSGGIDSGLIASMAAKINPDFECFTYAFHEQDHEIDAAKHIAQHGQIKHQVVKLSLDNLLKNIEDKINHFEQTYPSVELVLEAMQNIKQKGYKVCLTGNGADELFGGYHSIKGLKQGNQFNAYRFLKPFLPNFGKLKGLKDRMDIANEWDYYRHHLGGMRGPDALAIFPKEFHPYIHQITHKYGKSKPMDYQKFFEIEMPYSLSTHHVYRDDLSAMKYGVELRYPFLSKDLVDFVAQLPIEQRFDGRDNKILLKKLAQRYLPKEIIEQKKKGFSVNFEHYAASANFQKLLHEKLIELRKREFFNQHQLDRWRHEAQSHADFAQLWQLMSFELIMERYPLEF